MTQESSCFDQNTVMAISGRIQEARTKSGRKAIDTALELGISPDQYSRIERGITPCPLRHLYRLCGMFSVSADELLFGETGYMLNKEMAEVVDRLTLRDVKKAIRILKIVFSFEE